MVHINDPRQRAYLQLLDHGLCILRDYAHGKQIAICEIEADHLHNIPSLLGEPNEARHRFFIVKERGLYLDRLRQLGATEYLEQRMVWYSEPWKMLATIAGVELSE